MSKATVVQNTALCAIVRDEMVNLAGGIIDFVKVASPHFEEVVIVDTGSFDGTREVLAYLRRFHSNLVVRDYEFKGFADARNYALTQVSAEFTMVLDADERITEDSYETMNQLIKMGFDSGFFIFNCVFPDGETKLGPGLNPRLFRTKNGLFEKDVGEIFVGNKGIPKKAGSIDHYIPNPRDLEVKYQQWYGAFANIKELPAPSQTEGFMRWKTRSSLSF